ncbi:MAG TPA: hypothetical protein VEY70_23750 [Metabacillus sp.]|nr:hypothetical protein [Metabacillus sp.]
MVFETFFPLFRGKDKRETGVIAMFSEINAKLIEIKGELRKKQKYEAQLKDFHKELEIVEKRVNQLQILYKSEEKDVNQLEKMSLKNVFALLSGTKDEILLKEKRELIVVEHRLEEANKTKSEIDSAFLELNNKLHTLENTESNITNFFLKKRT